MKIRFALSLLIALSCAACGSRGPSISKAQPQDPAPTPEKKSTPPSGPAVPAELPKATPAGPVAPNTPTPPAPPVTPVTPTAPSAQPTTTTPAPLPPTNPTQKPSVPVEPSAPSQTGPVAPSAPTAPATPTAPTSPITNLEVFGSWRTPEEDRDGLKINSIITIAADRFTVKNTCTIQGKSVEIEASAKAAVDAMNIDILEPLEKSAMIEIDDKKIECGIHFLEVKLEYLIKEDKLYFTAFGQTQLVGEQKL